MNANVSIYQDSVKDSSGILTSESNEMDSSSVFNYNGSVVTFGKIGNTTYINATEMAKPFGKFSKDWTRLKSSQDFINALSSVRHICPSALIQVVKGGSGEQGTFMHEDVAIEFARWLSPEFAIWCNDRIKELLTTGRCVMPNFNDPAEAARAWANEYEAKVRAEKEAKLALEAKKISDNIIKEQAPKVGFAETAIMANDKGDDMLIRDVRRELESHGCDIAERSLREFLQEQGFFYKNKREWILTENVMKKGYAHYRYNTDTGIRNTVYMTRKGFEKTLYNIKNKPQSRESFISFGGITKSSPMPNRFAIAT